MGDLFDKFVPLIGEHEALIESGVRHPFGIVMEKVLGPTEAIIKGKHTILVGTYNYMGMTFDPDVIAAAQKALINFMVQASERIPSLSKGRAVWYVNRTIREQLRLGILEKIAGNLAWETVSGKRVMTFDDIPVKRLDAINNTEARVV